MNRVSRRQRVCAFPADSARPAPFLQPARFLQPRQFPVDVRANGLLGSRQALGSIKWTATGVPVFDRLATLGPGPQSVSMAIQLIIASMVTAYVLKIVADSWMRTLRRSNDPSDLRILGTRKNGLASTLLQSAVPVVSKTIPLLAISYSVTVLFSLLAVYEVYLRNMFLYTFIDESLVVRSVVMLSQFFMDCVDVLLIYATTLFLRNIKDLLVQQKLVKAITDGEFGDAMRKTGIKGNILPLVRLVNVTNAMLTYLLYFIALIASLDAFGFDVGPLVASISGVSVLIGIGMREVLENVAGAVTLVRY